jgi:hypothetical protein
MMLHLALCLKNLDGIIYVLANRKMQKAILMYKVTNNLTPMYLQDLFVTRVTHYRLRDSEGKLFLPKPRTDYLKRSFSYSGASLWNSLPESLRSSS